MDAPPPPMLGVAAKPPSPQPSPETTPLTAAPTGPVVVATPWPRSAQAATAVLLVLAAGLLGWHATNGLRWTSRPSELDLNASAGRIDLNHADRAQLLQLPGVGERTAEHIEEYRLSHNGFRNVDELRQVHGIGPASLARLRPYLDGDAEDVLEEGKGPSPSKVLRPVERRATGTTKGDSIKEPINVNEANAAELQRLPGVGPALSSRIIRVREQQPFRSVDELRRVPGIGAKTLERLRPFVTVGDQQ